MSRPSIGSILVLLAVCVGAPTSLPAQNDPVSAAVARQSEQLKLIATLESAESSQYDKVQACYRLAVIGSPESVPVLAALLSDEKLAHMARYALESMPDPAVDEALRAALGQLKGKLQVGVINSIGLRRDAQAVDALIPLLTHADPAVATAAAAALGRIGNPACANALQQTLAQAPENLRPAVAEACLVCAEQLVAGNQLDRATALCDLVFHADVPAPIRLAAMRGIILMQDSAGLPLLLEQLNSSDAAAVAMALSVARVLPGPEMTRGLAAELSSLPEDKQVLLLVALGDRADPAALPAVLASAKSGSVPTRVAALQVLAKLGDVSSVPLLLACAIDANAEVAQAAQATLIMLPGDPVDQALVASVGSGGNRMRLAAINALAQRRVPSAVPELSRVASGPDAGIRIAALHALGETVGLADFSLLTQALVHAATPDEISAANAALSVAAMRIGDKPALAEKLLAVLPQAGSQARGLLLLQLGQVGGAKALQAVRVGTQDPDTVVRSKAVRALAGWPDATAAPALAEIIRNPPDPALRDVAFRGYVRLVSESEIPADEKVKLLEPVVGLAVDAQDRKILLSALGETCSLGSLRLVTSYLGDPELADEVGAAAVKLSEQLGVSYKNETGPVLQKVLQSAKSKPILDATRKQLTQLGLPAE